MENNIGLVLQKRASLNPTLEGLVDVHSGQRFSFQQMDQGANRAAHLFLELGIKKGDQVGVLLMNSPQFLECFLGLAKIGAVIVPLNWRLVATELEYILKDSQSTLLLFGSEFAETTEALFQRGAHTEVRQWIQVGADHEIREFAQNYQSLYQQASAEPPVIEAQEDDLLYIMYTSGTTGLPKGVIHTHNTAIWALVTSIATADIRFKDRYLLSLPLYHVGALTPITTCIYAGNTTVLMRSFDPLKTWELIDEEKIDTMLAVPAMLNFMLQVPNLAQYDHSRLRWCMSGASPVPVNLIEAYAKMGIEVHQVYGLTESCGPGALISPDEALTKAGSTGKAFFHTEIRIIDEKGEDVPPNEPGELLVKGKHVMQGYWNNPEATAKAIKEGWLYTGDIAIMDEEGYLYIRDRVKDMIISGGENIYPAELENVLISHPLIKDVAVIGQADETWGEIPLAVVVPENGSLSEEDVLLHCQGKLARYKLPKGAVFIDEIPRNLTGKPLKRMLREKFTSSS